MRLFRELYMAMICKNSPIPRDHSSFEADMDSNTDIKIERLPKLGFQH